MKSCTARSRTEQAGRRREARRHSSLVCRWRCLFACTKPCAGSVFFISTAIIIGWLDAHFCFEEFLHTRASGEVKPKLLAVRYQRELKKWATLAFERDPFVQFLD